jgi:FkbM family methyltransferase
MHNQMALAEHPNVTEQQTQLAFRHLLRRGDVVYDVGAHRGWLTVPISHLIGHNGFLFSFEPSRRNLEPLKSAAQQHGLPNIEIVAAAVYHSTGQTVDLFENAFSATDSLYFGRQAGKKTSVSTIALDDFLGLTKLPPSLIKLDIEGAEHDALIGATELISVHQPLIIMEFRKSDRRALRWLVEREYSAYSLRDYEQVLPSAPLEELGTVENLLLAPASRKEDQRLAFLRHAPHPFERIDTSVRSGRLTLISGLDLQPGFNCFRLKSSAVNPYDNIRIQVIRDATCVINGIGMYRQVAANHNISFTMYATEPATADAAIVCASKDNVVKVEAVERRLVPLEPSDHDHHRALSVINPFGLKGDHFLALMREAIESKVPESFEFLEAHADADPSLSANLEFQFLKGIRAHHRRQYSEACEAFGRCRAGGFQPYWTNLHLARALRASGNIKEAIEAAQAAQQRHDTDEVRRLIGSFNRPGPQMNA